MNNSVAINWLRNNAGALGIMIGMLLMALFAGWLIDLDKQIKRSLAQYSWKLPAKVYARPLELHSGMRVSLEEIVEELQLLGFSEGDAQTPGNYRGETTNGESSNAGGANGISTLHLHTRQFEFSDYTEPAVQATLQFRDNTLQTLFIDARPADLLRLEPLLVGAIHPTAHEDRELVTIDELPPGFVEALVAVEDRQFFSHPGISVKGIIRAFLANLKSGSRTQGASTLTQQLVKNLFLTRSKTYRRKIREAAMSVLLEVRYSKQQILELFINEVFIAQDGNRAIHGFGLASRHFYNRPLKELETAQYALLIGMIKAPSAYHPLRHPARSTYRRNVVLDIMRSRDLLQEDQTSELKLQPLVASTEQSFSGANAAYLDFVRRQLIADYSLEDLQSDGLRIFSNYDPLLQLEVERSVEQIIASTSGSSAEKQRMALQAAVIVSDPNSGEIKAMLGGRPSIYSGFNRALDARRPVGSLLKPAIYLTAWEKHRQYSLASIIEDKPITLALPNGSVWQPGNYDNKHHGEVLMIDALARSLNLATANLGLELGVANVIETLKRLGVEAELPEIPALLLGATELSAIDILRMYQTVASSGYQMPLRAIRDVVDSEGNTLSHYQYTIKQVFSEPVMYLLRFAMTETMLRGTGRSAYRSLARDFYVAGKTGTTNGQRDSWFAGFSDDLLAVVWLGNDDNTETPLTGSTGALRVWTDIISRQSHRGLDFSVPNGISYAAVEPSSGRRTRENCKSAITLPFITGSEPSERVTCNGRGSKINQWVRSLFD